MAERTFEWFAGLLPRSTVSNVQKEEPTLTLARIRLAQLLVNLTPPPALSGRVFCGAALRGDEYWVDPVTRDLYVSRECFAAISQDKPNA